MQDDITNKNNQKFRSYNCCVVIPTYNNAASISNVINSVQEYCADIFVVNDGSTDETADILLQYQNIETISYAQNQGKGYALRYGFKAAYDKGFKYAISIDADGQHYASDLLKFIDELSHNNDDAIIIGSRMLTNKGQAKSSSFANKFANFWFKVETGESINDTQSGYRLYPLEHIAGRKWYSNKYEFELEVLVRSFWKGIAIKEIDIDVYYAPENERVSHFRPFHDFFRISVLNTVLVTLALLYYRPLLMIRKYRKKGLKQTLKEEFAKKENSNFTIAASIGFGFFMGVFPIWGYQLMVGLTLAHLMKLNKTLFFVAANISIPPMIPIILYCSLAIGAFVMGTSIDIFTFDISWEMVKNNLVQYLVGAVILSFVLAIFAGSTTYIILNKLRK